MEVLFDIPVMTFKDAATWESWLKQNYTNQTGVWVKLAKKSSGIASVTQPAALDICLCYGWIDGQRRSYDESYYLQKYTPRRSKSLWSKVNIGKVELLIANGRMQIPGMVEIERAKVDGRWDRAYESQANATVPTDLSDALMSNKIAKEKFESFGSVDRYHVLFQLMTAKTPELRVKRLQKILRALEE